MLRGLNHTFLPHELSQRLRARRDVGVIFFEDTAIAPDALVRARSFNTIVACSTWNYEVLRERGLTNVVMVPQGIDPTIFHPAPRADLFEDRFVVFSGGKLEYRKGQDIVVAAFRAFHARHPEALLLTAWHNHWRQTMVGIDAMGHVRGVPDVDATGRVDVTAWLAANGVPSSAVIDLGAVENHQMPRILREADLAIFPNRCEGGTNLVAMECLACGIPTVLSANTGHLDLVGDESGYALRDQRPVRGGCPLYGGYEGWGESSVEEAVEAMEAVYRDREDARSRGGTAARIMHDGWTWASRADELLDALARAGTWPA
jgi:glycosyltransferase involved in cell wall biosynthesis